MPEQLISALVFAPLLVALAATVVAWRFIERPVLFLVVGMLAMLGVQSLLAPAGTLAITYLFPHEQGQGASAPFVRGVVASAAGVALVGPPLLYWLASGFRRRKVSRSRDA